MDGSEIVSESFEEDERITLVRDGIQVELYKDPRGRFSVHVKGDGVDKKTLERAGEELFGRIRQQYAYQRIMTEMEKRGYRVESEGVGEDSRIKIKLERTG